MTTIAIVTDSSACLPKDLLVRSAVRVVPITIHLEDVEVSDADPGAGKLVFDALTRDAIVKSSAPSPLHYLQAIEEEDPAAAVVVTPATEFTVMNRNAHVAAKLAQIPVAVVDCRTAAAAQALVVLEAQRAAHEVRDIGDVVAAVERAMGQVELVAKLESVEVIGRSGRVPSPELERARKLGIRPVFRLKSGTVEPVAMAQTTDAALGRVRREWERGGGARAARTIMFHAGAPAEAATLAESIGSVELISEFSPAMSLHTGPGVVGAAWLRTDRAR